MALSVIALKAITGISIFVCSLIFAVLPVIFNPKNVQLRERMLSLGNAFAGGVFLGGGFSHLLPEASANFDELNLNRFPLAHILSVAGFLLVFFIEKVIFLKHSAEGGGGDHSHSHSFALIKEEDEPKLELTEVQTEENPRISLESNAPTIIIPPKPKGTIPNRFLPIILTLVLSLHSIIAGFTIGVQPGAKEVLAIFAAVISHKWTESFALGVTIVKSKVTSKIEILKYLSVYSMMAPLGLLLGALLSIVVSGRAELIVNAVVSGIASGTFIYIALVDILLREFTNPQDKWLKYLLCWIGFGLITASILLFDED